MVEKLPKAVIILHKCTSIYPRFYEIVAQNEYLEEVKTSFERYLKHSNVDTAESKTCSAISKDSAKKLKELFRIDWIPVGSQSLIGRQYIHPFLKLALEKEYPVYYHDGKELIETDSTKENLEWMVYDSDRKEKLRMPHVHNL
ncbi:MAG: hypothetical protein ABIF85_02165 [Nanoarchaeota archaeon]|nr:hypothetical protein [Nanoarchaeota archaeon]MBU4300853.1 hypothetical protein [Nanoarchaeota archaeon]MBU4451554.1 hypothetical protein [Nanoarchaeota archaeon]MCG2724485.1 hypothetical protein [archaeon]